MPAPGRGILTTARRTLTKAASPSANSLPAVPYTRHPCMDMDVRRRELRRELEAIRESASSLFGEGGGGGFAKQAETIGKIRENTEEETEFERQVERKRIAGAYETWVSFKF